MKRNEENIKQLRRLLKRYYSGESSLAEERELRHLARSLQGTEMPKELRADIELAGFLEDAAAEDSQPIPAATRQRFNSLIDRLAQESSAKEAAVKKNSRKRGIILRLSYSGVACAVVALLAIGVIARQEHWEYPNGESAEYLTSSHIKDTLRSHRSETSGESVLGVAGEKSDGQSREIQPAKAALNAKLGELPPAGNKLTASLIPAKRRTTTPRKRPSENRPVERQSYADAQKQQQLEKAMDIISRAFGSDQQRLDAIDQSISRSMEEAGSAITTGFECLNP